MDPTANLKVQLRLARRLLRVGETTQAELAMRALDGVELAEYVLSLHEWLTKGGFLPDQWKR